jgi:thiol-disulfide isomerase/thioredoxin
MNTLAKTVRLALLFGSCVVATGEAWAADRPAEAILRDLDAVQVPKRDVSKKNDQNYFREFMAKLNEAQQKRAAFILELYKTAPNHEQIPKLMLERWRAISMGEAKLDDLMKEIESVSTQTKDPKFKIEAAYAKGQIKLAKSLASGTPDLSASEEFIKLAPKDPRGARLLYIASDAVKDKQAKAALVDRILNDYPDSSFAGMIKGSRRQKEAIGKPFELEFTDAIKGSTVSIKGLKGKVVVIDFWATWCGPCVAEMPNMKTLYAKYRDQGVEFIGVSLDQSKEQGGLDKLKKFVAEKEIAWPQYYQGNFWDSEFSGSWGINSIPCVFVVDAEGKLFSVDARGKLEEMIPELLKKKVAPATAGGE